MPYGRTHNGSTHVVYNDFELRGDSNRCRQQMMSWKKLQNHPRNYTYEGLF